MKEAVYSIAEASKILGISRKTLYARVHNEKYKKCFVIVPDIKTSFIYYKKHCIEEELNNKVTEKEKFDFTSYYYDIFEKATINEEDIDKKENIFKKIITQELKEINYQEKNIHYITKKIVLCNPSTKKELELFNQILHSIESKYCND